MDKRDSRVSQDAPGQSDGGHERTTEPVEAVAWSDVPLCDPGTSRIHPILKFPGAKWRLGLAITGYFPPHLHYIEPYFGSGACFFLKKPSIHEVINDLDSRVVNLFRVLRTRGEELAQAIALTPWSEEEYALVEHSNIQPIGGGGRDELEHAREFLLKCWQMHGTQLGKSSNGWRHNGIHGHAYPARLWEQLPDRLLAVIGRLKQAEIRHRPALEIIESYNHPDCLIYADPPYLRSTRRSEGHYRYEMTDDDHAVLLEVLDRHTGAVILSGYAHPLYDERLTRWQRIELPSVTEHGIQRTEVLWLNQRAARPQQLALFPGTGSGVQ